MNQYRRHLEVKRRAEWRCLTVMAGLWRSNPLKSLIDKVAVGSSDGDITMDGFAESSAVDHFSVFKSPQWVGGIARK